MISGKPAISKKQDPSKEASTDLKNMIRKNGSHFLLQLKRKSLRINNSWYRVLDLGKRRFIDAVIQTINEVRSDLLLRILVDFTQRLLQAIGGIRGLLGSIAYDMQTFGRSLAQKISIIAQKWGYKAASKWENDEGFMRFLVVIDINNLPIFRVNKP